MIYEGPKGFPKPLGPFCGRNSLPLDDGKHGRMVRFLVRQVLGIRHLRAGRHKDMIDARPLEIGAYIQDKLEFKGMIANVGLRADYFNPNKKGYRLEHPLDEDYADFYNLVYEYLPGEFGSWEKWVEFREMLDQPSGWPATETKAQLKLEDWFGAGD